MPELPIYKEHGIGPQQFGQINYTNLQDEIRRGRGLEEALDRLSNWAYKKMEGRAKQAGAEWAAQNPITQEQLTAALNEEDTNERNKNLAKLIGGDPSTVTGAAILDVQIGQARSMLELNARKEVAGIDALAQTGQLKPGEVLQQLNALSSGYSEVLSKMGGAAGAKEAESLRASIASISQPVFNAVSQRFIKQHDLAARAAIDSGISQVQTTLRPLFDALVTAPEGEGRDAALANLSTAQARIRTDLTRLAITHGYDGALSKLDSAISGANIAAITDYLGTTGDMSNALGAIGSGKVGNLTPIFALMSDDDKDKLRNSIRTYYADQTSAGRQAEEAKKRKGMEEAAPYMTAFMKSGGMDTAAFDEIIKLNSIYGMFEPTHLATIKSSAESMDDLDYSKMNAFVVAAWSGRVPIDKLVSTAKAMRLNAKETYTALGQIVSANAGVFRADAQAAQGTSAEIGGDKQDAARVERRFQDRLNELREINNKKTTGKRTDNELRREVSNELIKEDRESDYQKRVTMLNERFSEGNLGLDPKADLNPGYITATVQRYEARMLSLKKSKSEAKSWAIQLKAGLEALAKRQKDLKGK